MTQKITNHFLAPTAKRLVKQWANDHSEEPEDFIQHRYIADLTSAEAKAVFTHLREIAGYLRKAFEVKEEYDRDWYLFMARYKNAVYAAPVGPQFATMPGVIPIAKDTEFDRAVSFVQAKLARRMAVCEREGCSRPCYFRTRKGSKYCGKRCFRIVNKAGKLRYYHEVGSELRRMKAK